MLVDQITLIQWKDERWSANKEQLKGINDLINQNRKIETKMIQKFIEKIFYILGWVITVPTAGIKWISFKFKKWRN